MNLYEWCVNVMEMLIYICLFCVNVMIGYLVRGGGGGRVREREGDRERGCYYGYGYVWVGGGGLGLGIMSLLVYKNFKSFR